MRGTYHHYTINTNSGIGLRRMSNYLRASAQSKPTIPDTYTLYWVVMTKVSQSLWAHM